MNIFPLKYMTDSLKVRISMAKKVKAKAKISGGAAVFSREVLMRDEAKYRYEVRCFKPIGAIFSANRTFYKPINT